MRSADFESLLETAQRTPDLPGALASVGVELRGGKINRYGAECWKSSTAHGVPGDYSSVIFMHNPDGSWVAIDNKERTGRKILDAIGVMTNFFDLSFNDAVILLSGGRAASKARAAVKPDKQVKPVPEHYTPPARVGGSPARVFAYLTKSRMIPQAVVSELLKLDLIYETVTPTKAGKAMPLAAFSIRDTQDKIVGTDLCGVYSLDGFRFKCFDEGSDPLISWRFCNRLQGGITKDTKLFFCESAIDAISLCCLTNAPGVYLSMVGVKDETMLHMAELLGGTPVICTDNDEAGNRFRNKYSQYDTLLPAYGKDWNDELKYRTENNLDFALKGIDAPPSRAAHL